jgi:hypothetical protein
MGKNIGVYLSDAKDLAQSLLMAFFQSVGGGTLGTTK